MHVGSQVVIQRPRPCAFTPIVRCFEKEKKKTFSSCKMPILWKTGIFHDPWKNRHFCNVPIFFTQHRKKGLNNWTYLHLWPVPMRSRPVETPRQILELRYGTWSPGREPRKLGRLCSICIFDLGMFNAHTQASLWTQQCSIYWFSDSFQVIIKRNEHNTIHTFKLICGDFHEDS